MSDMRNVFSTRSISSVLKGGKNGTQMIFSGESVLIDYFDDRFDENTIIKLTNINKSAAKNLFLVKEILVYFFDKHDQEYIFTGELFRVKRFDADEMKIMCYLAHENISIKDGVIHYYGPRH